MYELTFPRWKRLLVFGVLISCFALWGLLNNMTDNLVPAFQRIFQIDQAQAGAIQISFYGAYPILAIFAGILAEEFSYRVGVLVGLGACILGGLLFIPAYMATSFDIFFLAVFVVAAGCALVEVASDPYALSLGDAEHAVWRLNFAQAFNPIGSLIGIFLAQKFILAKLNPATAAERAQMVPESLKGIVDKELFWCCVPYVGVSLAVLFIWFFFLGIAPIRSPFPEKAKGLRRVFTALVFALGPVIALYFLFPNMNKMVWISLGVLGPIAYVFSVKEYRALLKILAHRARYCGGVVAQFFNVGVQIAGWTWLNVYCCKELGVTPDTAASYYLIALVLFTIFRWVTTELMKYISAPVLLAVFAFSAALFSAGAMYLPSTTWFTVAGLRFTPNVICLVCMSAGMSLMFPTIYGLALGGLDPKAFKLGAAGLVMADLGGAVITPWMGGVLGAKASAWFCLVPGASAVWDAELRTSHLALRSSFAIPVICYLVVFAYALFVFFGSRRAKEAQA